MMKTQLIFTTAAVLLLCSCSSGSKSPAVIYPSDSTSIVAEQPITSDSTLLRVGELPLHFDSTSYLIFPVGLMKIDREQKRGLYSDFANTGGDVFSLGYMNGSSYSGRFENLIIQHLDSSEFHKMTDRAMNIRSFRFLKSVFRKNKKQLLLMTVTDMDSNRDANLSNEDIESLYLFDLENHRIIKLSEDFQELLDFKVLEINNRLYFRTLEDIDKNGEFNLQDKMHHFFVDLAEPRFEVREFDPFQ